MGVREITFSIVSHGQNALVNLLLQDIERVCAERVELVLTENIIDPVTISTRLPFAHIVNATIKGFGANHNAAFRHCQTEYFCVCNPDIRLGSDPFPRLLSRLQEARTGVAGPLVRGLDGGIEDSARRFPTFWSLLAKTLVDLRVPDYPVERGPQVVDWVGGMFMIFRREAFETVRGFDEAYFLYYEDVDICNRLRTRGWKAVFSPDAEVLHHAQRTSRREWSHARHHLASAWRFLSRRRAG